MPRHAAPCARLSPPLSLLLERRNPPPSPGSLASELASHIHPADCFLFDPDASSRGVLSTQSAAILLHSLPPKFCKLQFDPTRHRHNLQVNWPQLSANKLTASHVRRTPTRIWTTPYVQFSRTNCSDFSAARHQRSSHQQFVDSLSPDSASFISI